MELRIKAKGLYGEKEKKITIIVDRSTFNVKNYGAKGDGINDDTNAIRNAIEEAKNVENAKVYFPEGTYLTRQFKIYSNMNLLGDGISKTKLVRIVDDNWQWQSDPLGAGDSTYFRSFITNIDFRNGNSNIGIYNMTINGNGYAFALDEVQNHHNYIIQLKRVDSIKIDNLRLEDGMNWQFSARESKNIHIGYLEIDGNTQRGTRVNDRNNQDGANFHGSYNVVIDKLIVYESYDDSLAILGTSREGTPLPAYNYHIKYLEVYRQVGTGSGLVLASKQPIGSDVHDVRIDYVKLHWLGGKGSITIHYGNYAEIPEGAGYGKIYNVYIDRVDIENHSNINKPAIFISSRPPELIEEQKYTKYGMNRFENITINQVNIDYKMQNLPEMEQKGIEIEGVNSIRINEINDVAKSNARPNIRIAYSSDVTINKAYIQRVTTGGWSLITVSNSNNILIDNVTMPLALDGEKQGNVALYVIGDSKNITLRYKQLETRGVIKFDNVPEENKSSIVAVQI